MIIKLIYLLFSALIAVEPSSAMTFPKPELLLYNSDTLFIDVEYREDSPLANLFLLKKYSAKLEAEIDTTCWSSACTRQYAPIWKIKNNKLYLYRLEHCCSEKEVNLNQIFKKRKISNDGVKAFWVDEKINVRDMDLFTSTYVSFFELEEYDKIKSYEIEVQKGIVKSLKEEKDE